MSKKLLLVLVSPLLLLLVLLFSFNAYPHISANDKVYISNFLRDWKINEPNDSLHQSFDREVDFISRVQDSIVYQLQGDLLSFDSVGAVSFYYTTHRSLCFDRAILMEKIFSYYRFPVRHIYIYYRTDSSMVKSREFFKKGLRSHALLEVKTKKGWMLVGTSSNWVGIDASGTVFNIVALRKKLRAGIISLKNKPTYGPPFYETMKLRGGFRFIYGLYSRHGEFFRSKPIETGLKSLGICPTIPDYNIRSLLYNL